ncbi:anhydro-N-acetylmuramic acid kinase [Marinicella sp. S1101]|uniref:anhydro-N-acetylmuramic acid kinase n=1 Tax=Marinicella marina TaxID=2996016 RepID=UPI002260DD23|nr:anhydro-N-acetylmuramic acid kinase [Marinicella marina]MCX7553495.1 anhydro-N-acetylmuramic acid kinase [Marinicella marina]MDJ1140119.1 anhydro-N-acetylmuramic acid kinase [Marinicella marina]
MRFIGVMSGTSCDGVDVVYAEIGAEIKVLAAGFYRYSDAIRAKILHVIANQPITIAELSQLDTELGMVYADAINDFINKQDIIHNEIKAIGLHGQTIFHQPPTKSCRGYTMQIGSAAVCAQMTQIQTVADFRSLDMAFGGQGAPLAPALHQHLFAADVGHTVVLNLGGIANITSLSKGAVLGFDTGPASCLMDEWIKQNKGLEFDHSGQWAKTGKVHEGLLKSLLSEPFFSEPFPKSTGRELFNLKWLEQQLCRFNVKAADVQRTLLQLTVDSIGLGLAQLETPADVIVVCGGGVHNTFMMEHLRQNNASQVKSSQAFGINPDYVEALLMAWMAHQFVLGEKLDLRSITGVSEVLLYGRSYAV